MSSPSIFVYNLPAILDIVVNASSLLHIMNAKHCVLAVLGFLVIICVGEISYYSESFQFCLLSCSVVVALPVSFQTLFFASVFVMFLTTLCLTLCLDFWILNALLRYMGHCTLLMKSGSIIRKIQNQASMSQEGIQNTEAEPKNDVTIDVCYCRLKVHRSFPWHVVSHSMKRM